MYYNLKLPLKNINLFLNIKIKKKIKYLSNFQRECWWWCIVAVEYLREGYRVRCGLPSVGGLSKG